MIYRKYGLFENKCYFYPKLKLHADHPADIRKFIVCL